ncbi:type II toxin-antitoxin system ParD family antitoxin [Devosia sp.]|uniref:type II toxin-antitoxin system ParD family antitoxin n=1 Tax=Devosia sp. TaxID=1871048 RepID=UPI0027368A50|nr:type II toxin-antitoxin system ParD family antitoxin [Devosia sp.]MDP2779184.1 type II toxin-antitoxin system ParD family antitoxin [Devosia sp.]
MAISAELGEALEQAVSELVATGRYNSKSEVLREGVRLVQEREARFRELAAKIQVGQDDIDAGRVHSADEVFKRVRKRIEEAAAKKAS